MLFSIQKNILKMVYRPKYELKIENSGRKHRSTSSERLVGKSLNSGLQAQVTREQIDKLDFLKLF